MRGEKGLFGALVHVQRGSAAPQSLEWLSVRGAGRQPRASRAPSEAELTAAEVMCDVRRGEASQDAGPL